MHVETRVGCPVADEKGGSEETPSGCTVGFPVRQGDTAGGYVNCTREGRPLGTHDGIMVNRLDGAADGALLGVDVGDTHGVTAGVPDRHSDG